MNESPSEIALAFWRSTFLITALIAALAVFGLPHGFPLSSAHFWCNSVLPPVILSFSVAGLIFIIRKKPRFFLVAALTCLSAWLSLILASWVIFPMTMRLAFALPPLVFIALLAWLIRKNLTSLKFSWVLPGVIAGLAAGVFLPWSQRGLEAATRPLNKPLIQAHPQGERGADLIEINKQTSFSVAAASLTMNNGLASLSVDPLLVFHSCSPDRSWTLLARPRDRVSPPIHLHAVERKNAAFTAFYSQAGVVNRSLSLEPQGQSVNLEALAHLERPVYSHLNTFCEMDFSARGKLSLSFSPCPENRIEIVASDYPVGRPARFAYVDKNGRFRVVEASSAEKGPFTSLAEGEIKPNEPFTLCFYVDDKKLFSVEMNDWLSQASIGLSPTAGWGVPENAIEFQLDQQRAYVFSTLAGTSVGRGFQSVGHQAGGYRNRLKVTSFPMITGSTASER